MYPILLSVHLPPIVFLGTAGVPHRCIEISSIKQNAKCRRRRGANKKCGAIRKCGEMSRSGDPDPSSTPFCTPYSWPSKIDPIIEAPSFAYSFFVRGVVCGVLLHLEPSSFRRLPSANNCPTIKDPVLETYGCPARMSNEQSFRLYRSR